MTISVAPSVSAPALAGWRTITAALACALLIGGIGGLIGLGGGEFRLPLLVGLIGFTARAAVPMNQILSLITLMTALLMRWHTGALVGVGVFGPAVVALGLGGTTAAWFAARLLARTSDHRLERAIAILLMAIGVLLIGERFLPAGLPALVPAEPGAQIVAGIMEWRKGNTFATTAFLSYGLFWLSLVALVLLAKLGWGAPSNDTAMAAYLAMWGLFTAVMFIGTLQLNRALQVVFATLTILFFMLAIGDYTGASVGFKHFTGYEGILCGFSAIYAGLAQVLNELFGGTVLPLGPVKK